MTASLLIVDDTPENIDLVASMLEGHEAVELMAATSGERALELVQRRLPDLVLLDVMMPGIDGFETCRRLRKLPGMAEVPVLFVTAKTDEVGEGFAAGGSDYLSKPVRADELRARVRHHLERRRLLRTLQTMNAELEERVRERTQELMQANRQLREEINERRFMQDRLSYLATHDFVTRLYNRDALENQVQLRLLERGQPGDPGCLLMLDLARFRNVNDSCGYIAGDELLRQVADLLAALSSPAEFIARLGGDRFALLTPERAEGALRLAQRLKQAFEGFHFQWDGRAYPIDARIAVVPLAHEFLSFDQVMAKADEACYLLRADGGQQVRLHRSQVGDADPREAVAWLHRLMDAIQQQHLRVFFQRIVPLQQDAEPGLLMEVLVRLWDPSEQRIVPPGVFLPHASRYQLIEQIDHWMLRETLGQLVRMPELLAAVRQVSVNLSAQMLRDAQLAERIDALLRELSFPPEKLCLEITESEAVVNLDQAQAFMTQLKARGVRFSLDDFGTGFASFAYLKRLPFDRLKIDGAFVKDMDSDPANAAMVASMVQMAQALGLPVVAEFVERGAVVQRLRELGVQYAQGYYFHQPEALSEASLRAALAA